ncbi:MAG: hypothetical protein QME42_11140 [bacterium]|nr:hypothetical protein [bacterium]
MQDVFSEEFCKLETTERSFFDLIDDLWLGENPNKAPLHRIFSLMRKMKAKSYLLEPLLLNTELIEEKEMAEELCEGKVDLKARRITFFCSFPQDDKWKDSDILPDEHLLGYAVVITLILPNRKCYSYVLESVLRPPSVAVWDKQNKQQVFEPITNYYIHNVREFKTMIGTSEQSRIIPISGSFFSQQNGLTSVCAHASIRMAINSSSMFQNIKITNKRINTIVNMDFSSSTRRPLGLTLNEIEMVVKELGGRIISVEFEKDTSVEYDHFIYPIIESGYPVILAVARYDFKKRRESVHAIAILGHTINSDRWGPEARQGYRYFPVMDYIPTIEWVDHLIIGDDNYGIYGTLPNDMIRNFIVPTKNPNLHVIYAIGIVPQDVILSGYQAEIFATKIAQKIIKSAQSQLSSPEKWLERMYDPNSKFTCRTLLKSNLEYLKELDTLLSHSVSIPIDMGVATLGRRKKGAFTLLLGSKKVFSPPKHWIFPTKGPYITVHR